ncbi:peptidyl-prolyl cis-trans isomerase [Candidatus Poribacteria bacterium]|nr:peptidyl-prolyl cis-trans isomerase [Candidatus Poribacteria bacterium]
MKKIVILVTLFITCFLTWTLVRSDNHDAEQQKIDNSQIIIAEYKWKGELNQISLAELEAAIAELPVYRQQNYSTKEGKAEYLEDYIDEKLKLLQATDLGFDQLEDFLNKIEDYTYQLMVEKLTEIEVDAKVQISEDDLLGYYDEHKSDYIEEARVRATCITLDDEDLANATLDKIKEGKDIIEMAKELSDDNKIANGPGKNLEDPGNTNFFSKTASPNWSEFIEAVFEQEIGEMTDSVFETDVDDATYYLIFRKEEHNPDRQKEFEEVKSDVERKVLREKKRERIFEWIKEMSTAANLKTYPENIPTPPETEESEEDDE